MKKKLALGLAAVLLLALAQGAQSLLLLPTEVTRFEGDDQTLGLDLPWAIRIDDSSGILGEKSGQRILNTVRSGTYNFSIRFLGLISLKKVAVNIIPRLELVPSGHSVGVKIAGSGVVVAGLDNIMTGTGKAEPAKDSGFRVGDILLAVDGIELKNLSHAAIVLEELCDPQIELQCRIARGGQEITLMVTPVYDVDMQRLRLGLLLRDTAAGVGTMTFYHEDTGYFGALGHMITDDSGGKPMDLSSGQVVDANVISIRRGEPGKPGEKQGVFEENRQPLGVIETNTELGIFGRLLRKPNIQCEPLPLGLKHEVKTGKAEILTVLEGQGVRTFSIEIEKIFMQNKPASKGMVVKITDRELLAATGGIIQGMSGSPILQNGKLIGAITHVFINEPQRGYGCFAEWMVLESGILTEIESFMPPEKWGFLIIFRLKSFLSRDTAIQCRTILIGTHYQFLRGG